MRIRKKLDPYQRLEHIRAAGELQWDVNQGKIIEAGVNPLLARDRKIHLAGWGQGAAWAHKAIAGEFLDVKSPKPEAKYADLKPFPADADRNREFPDGSVETCCRVLMSFLEIIDEALADPDMGKPELAATTAVCRLVSEDFRRALNAVEVTERMLSHGGGESGESSQIEDRTEAAD